MGDTHPLHVFQVFNAFGGTSDDQRLLQFLGAEPPVPVFEQGLGFPVEGVLVPSLWGSRTDQILASQAFDFELDDDPDVERILMSLSLLAGNEFLTAEQRKQAEDYLVMVKRIESMRTGQTAPERSALFWADITRRAAIDALDQEVGGTEE